MLGSLLAYDGDGNVIATLDHLVARDAHGDVVGLVDFMAHEAAAGEHTDIWTVLGAKGSKVWPEWLGGRAHDFRVELDGPDGGKRIAALVHQVSGERRDRADLEARIDAAIAAAREADQPADLRAIVGGPDRPLAIDDNGLTVDPTANEAPPLPIVGFAAEVVQP